MGAGVPVDIYCTYNGIYTSKEFTRELHGKVQVIIHSGVGGNYHNGVAYNSINNVVRIARTMMILYALRWPDASDKRLWAMDMAHVVHSHNHTPHISSGISPEEVWTSSNSSNSVPHNFMHGDALYMSCNQYYRMGTIFLNLCQGLGEINIWDILLCMPAQWAWSGTHKL